MKSINIISILLVCCGLNSCSRQDKIIGINENIRHDDFEYRVSAVETRKSIQADHEKIESKGIFIIVTFTVENQALRVGHKWNNQIGYIESGSGEKYENDVAVQKLLNSAEPFNWQENYNTAHGETESTKLVFDVPAGSSALYLKVRGETLMGDVSNFNRFKRTKIKIM
jgi:hypothetical protein